MVRTKSNNKKEKEITKDIKKGDKIKKKAKDVKKEVPKEKRRYKIGTIVKKEIKKYQKSSGLLVSRSPFQRLVREKCDTFRKDVYFSSKSFVAIQEATELYLVGLLQDSNKTANSKGRETVMKRDIILANYMRGNNF